jgi:hypothetical protein
MPGGDRTGPHGAGPMTGRGAGFCAGYGAPEYGAPGFGGGRGFGRSRGFAGGGQGGRGWRNRFYATGVPRWARGALWGPGPTPASDLEWLSERAQALESELKEVRTRLTEMETKGRDGA